MDPTRVAAVLAVLAVTACGTHDRSTSSPSPSPSSSAPASPADAPPPTGWRTTIPADLPLDAALPADGGDFRRGTDGVDLDLCGEPVAGPPPVDLRRASATGPEYGESRELRVFGTELGAQRLLADVERAVAACPAQEVGTTTWLHELRPSALEPVADAAYTVVRTYVDADGRPLLGADFWELVRVGNAVLLTASGGEYDAATSLSPGIRTHAGEIGLIVESLCVYAADPCAAGPRQGSSTWGTVVDPSGLGNLALGDSGRVVEGIGGEVTDRTTGSGCRVVDLWVNDRPDLIGNLDPGLGLAVILATRDGPARTDRGVGIGSPRAEVVAAYPRGEGDEVLWSAPAAGYDDRHWRFWFDRAGRLDELMLLLDDQHCGG